MVEDNWVSSDTVLMLRDWLDEQTKVFVVDAFVKFLKLYMIHRYEENMFEMWHWNKSLKDKKNG